MKPQRIVSLETSDLRFPSKAVRARMRSIPAPSMPSRQRSLQRQMECLGPESHSIQVGGNELVGEAEELIGSGLVGPKIEELMANVAEVSRQLAQDPQLRWLGAHKGVVHLAPASLTNACFDLWAKAQAGPLCRLLLDLTPRQVVDVLDLSYLEYVLTEGEALQTLQEHSQIRFARAAILRHRYPGHDTSVRWFNYEDARVKNLALDALERGFRAFKLKVGSRDAARDVVRATMLREVVGQGPLMLDANQRGVCCRRYSPIRQEQPRFRSVETGHAGNISGFAVGPSRWPTSRFSSPSREGLSICLKRSFS
jgi:hypothetical protein